MGRAWALVSLIRQRSCVRVVSTSISTADAIARYIAVRHRLPQAPQPAKTTYVNNLSDLVDEFDLFVLDGFGVLNVGADPVPGAIERVNSLRDAGKQVVVLTNGATAPTSVTVEKYLKWGMHFEPMAVVSSRDALLQALQDDEYVNKRWGVAATSFAAVDTMPGLCHLLEDDDAAYEACDGFILLSALDWSEQRQKRLVQALQKSPRPVLVGNPDLVAPRPEGLSLEPGWYAHRLADELGIEPVFYGKPFNNAFDVVTQRFPNYEPHRIAMVGDSPHTDILGGAGAGWRTVLIHDHGLCKGHDVETVFSNAGIRADFVANTT